MESLSDVSSLWQSIEQKCAREWINPRIIYQLLTSISSPTHGSPPYQPQSGTVAVFDRIQCKGFREDGYRWKVRQRIRDGKLYDTVHEKHRKVPIDGQNLLNCNWVSLADDDYFYRRIYWVLDNKDNKFVFVHYRLITEEEKLGKKKTKSAAVTPSLPRPSQAITVSSAYTESTAAPSLATAEQHFGVSEFPTTNGFDQGWPQHAGSFSDMYDGRRSPGDGDFPSMFDASFGDADMDHLDHSLPPPSLYQPLPGFQDSSPPQAGFSPQHQQYWPQVEEGPSDLFLDGVNGSTARRAEFHGGDSSVLEPFTTPPAFPYEVVDFAPNEAPIAGGEKLLVCLRSSYGATLPMMSVFCVFGNAQVSATVLTTNALKCIVPPLDSSNLRGHSQPIAVDLKIVVNGRQVTPAVPFYYRPPPPPEPPKPRWVVKRRNSYTDHPLDMSSSQHDASQSPRGFDSPVAFTEKRPYSRVSQASSQHSLQPLHEDSGPVEVGDDTSHQMKIRVIARDDQSSVSKSEQLDKQTSSPDQDADDPALASLDEAGLENVTEELLQRVMYTLLLYAKSDESLKDELLALDENGLGILHYTCLYNFVPLVKALLEHGADPNALTQHGQKPLHLAASRGHAMVASVLIAHGSDVSSADSSGLRPYQRAEAAGFPELAAALEMAAAGRTVDWSQVPEARTSSPGLNDGSLVEFLQRFSNDSPSPSVKSSSVGPTPATSVRGGTPSTILEGPNETADGRLLLEAFSSLSLHDRCAISLAVAGEPDLTRSPRLRGDATPSRSLSPAEVDMERPTTPSDSDVLHVPQSYPLASGSDGNSNGGRGGGGGGGGGSTAYAQDPSFAFSLNHHGTAFRAAGRGRRVAVNSTSRMEALPAASAPGGAATPPQAPRNAAAASPSLSIRARFNSAVSQELESPRSNYLDLNDATSGSGLSDSPSALRSAALARALPSAADSRLQHVIAAMSRDELFEVEREANVIKANVRAWVLRKNYQNTRKGVKRLQAAMRGLLARRHYQATKEATTTIQAATRGMLARKSFQSLRRQVSAALVIQRRARDWLHRNGPSPPPMTTSDDNAPSAGGLHEWPYLATINEE